ncbi:MAG TPA: type I secretion system permease/ATPase [Allosphingosinicella sp.]|nr:type I secretion system permease/ATPase [Allosphingosinicella sp.]
MGRQLAKRGQASELRAALGESRAAFIGVGIVSAVLNVLLLAGSIYMMLIYDSVLPSHSTPTLFSLLILVSVVYVFQGVFDVARTRILMDIATRLDLRMTSRVQSGISLVALRGRTSGDGLTPMRDLDQIRSFLSSQGPAALMDLPWILFFLAILYLLHFWLGFATTLGAIVLAVLTLITDRASRRASETLTSVAAARNAVAEGNRRHVEVVQALGMHRRLQSRWTSVNGAFLSSQQDLAKVSGTLGGISKVFRLFLQSLVLTVGALLVISGDATAGVIFASSILAARALAPVDQAIANWRGFIAARQGYQRLNALLAQTPFDEVMRTELPPPSRELRVDHVAVVPPGSERVAVQQVSFALKAGDALAVLGPSASGKSSLVRALVGVWPPARGSVRLDGATFDQWDPEVLGTHIGYLPQNVELLEGTVAENISRFSRAPDSETIVAAARAAGIHEMIVALPDGYETRLGSAGGELSAGQRQRIALARALHGDPFLVVLDEPNSNLDSEGEAALDLAIRGVRQRGGIVLVVAHRPAALNPVNYVLFLRNGAMEQFGPRDEVLKKILAKQPARQSGRTPPPLEKQEAS